MTKWIKDNWPVVLLIGILLVIIVVFIISRVKISDYRGDIKAKDALIEKIMVEYQSMEDSVTVSKELIHIYEKQLSIYQDSLQDSKSTLINQNKRHAKQVADLTRIPTDSLYVNYIRWIDSVSFE